MENVNLNLDAIKQEYERYDSLREKLIIQARAVLKSAKKLSYSVHRDETGDKALQDAKKEFKKLIDISNKDEKLKGEGSFRDAAEEYAEALLYHGFVNKNIPTCDEIGVSQESYLGALSDLSGELVRRAVNLVIKGKRDEVFEIHDFVEKLYKSLLKFNFRSGLLRKKSDAVRWNLNKLEDILYDLEVRKS
jgi:predicted translin family RNA/ssDNA-binding protein